MAGVLLALSACQATSVGNSASEAPAKALTQVTITTATGPQVFKVEMARTAQEQQNGLMYRTDIPRDGGMLFAPYPSGGEAPREANFWMKNTPSSLDILYIRADNTVARIAENMVPFSETLVPSGEPVAAVLEINGGESAARGIAEGDTVRWTSP